MCVILYKSIRNKTIIKMSKSEEENPVLQCFRNFDKEGKGYLTLDEFTSILTNLGDKFSEEEVDALYKEMGPLKKDKIDYEEFVSFWEKL